MALVLDASMTIAWLFEDERTEASDRILETVTQAGALVPSHWKLEVANVLRTAVRKGRCEEADVDQALADLQALPIEIDDETNRHAWKATRDLTREKGLTSYDAAYLELAIRSGLDLASRDRSLIAAARALLVEVHTG